MNYTALQVKTSYSILNSLNDIKKLVKCAVSYGYSSLAITDEDNMFGVMEFYLECKKNNIKPIIGIELSVLNGKILLYAKDLLGYKNIIKLSTIRSYKDITLEDLKLYSDNVILIIPFSFYNDDIYNIYSDKYIGYKNKEERDSIHESKVLITDVSYINLDDDIYLDYLKMIKDGKVLSEYIFGENKGRHLLKWEEVLELSEEEDILNTKKICDSCNLSLEYTEGLLPIYDKDKNARDFLREMAYKGLDKRLNGNVSLEYKERLEKELQVINEMGFNDYFLIVYDYVLYAKKNNILVGPGRGSAAGSLVSYVLGITDIDPIKYNLLFERFLNKERVTMPDIDIDFDANKRQEVIDYVTSKYGEKKVVGIITFNTLAAKQVIRDVGKVLKINSKVIDMVAKLCDKDLMTSYNENANLKKLVNNSDELKKLYNIALHLEGLPRHISIHAAGVVMSKYDIDNIIPLYKNQMGMYLSAYSKDYLEPLGLLKMDFLGISNLTLIDEVIKNIQKDLKINITFNNIPMDDKRTIELFSKGDTSGIFQFESPGMIKFLKQLKANNFLDIVAAISLYRPGPMDSIPEYLKRRSGNIDIDYIHEDLKDILKDTYGIIIYQEQIMQIASVMAGYSLGEADILRRAMSKKKEEILLAEREKFITNSINRGYTKDISTRVYDLILKFANYGFNKSHAVAYAVVAYKMAFLKVHFYSYFMTAVLNNAISNEDRTSKYIATLRQRGIKVLSPDINRSLNKYEVINKEIICPLSIVRNIGNNLANIIIKERERGEFTSFIDFALRMYSQSINRKVLESLVFAGCFDNYGYNKKTLMENMDNILNYVELSKDAGMIKIEEPMIDVCNEYNQSELVRKEFEIFGFYLSNHPVMKYRKDGDINTLYLQDMDNKYINIILEVNNIREVVTKRNDVMAFFKCSDEYRQIDVILFPKEYKENKNINVYDIINIYGKVEKRLDNYQVVATKIINYTRD